MFTPEEIIQMNNNTIFHNAQYPDFSVMEPFGVQIEIEKFRLNQDALDRSSIINSTTTFNTLDLSYFEFNDNHLNVHQLLNLNPSLIKDDQNK